MELDRTKTGCMTNCAWWRQNVAQTLAHSVTSDKMYISVHFIAGVN